MSGQTHCSKSKVRIIYYLDFDHCFADHLLIIVSRHGFDRICGQPPQSKALQSLAYSLVKLDYCCLYNLQTMLEHSSFTYVYEAGQITPPENAGIKEALAVLDSIMGGHKTPSAQYLRDQPFVAYWTETRTLIRDFMNLQSTEFSDEALSETRRLIAALDKSFVKTESPVLEALRSEQLDDKMQAAIRLRWLNLDLVHDTFAANKHDKRKSKSW